MPCYHPLLGHRSQKTSENGKRPISFQIHEAFADLPVVVPCGKCIGCKTAKAEEWAARCYHESKMHENSYFVTLTYNPENVPEGGTLVKMHLQQFIRNLRDQNPQEKIRYYACGEYGSQGHRPHYHILLFGHRFSRGHNHGVPDDLVLHSRNKQPGQQLYTSKSLEKLWPYGFSTVAEFTQATALYVAKYSLKKITGDLAEKHYQGRIPEFALMSLKPGIGAGWFDKYTNDVYMKDFFTINGRKFKPPRYYDKLLEKKRPKCLEYIKNKRREFASKDNTTLVRRSNIGDAKTVIKKQFERRKFENE